MASGIRGGLRRGMGGLLRFHHPTTHEIPDTPAFGYKNHVGIDREHGLPRRYTVTHAAAYDGGQLGAVLDGDNTASDVWADTAYRSAANLALLDRRGLKPQFQRKKPRGKKMPPHIARGNATRARVKI
jgi:transposase, IS5 family